ncbi:bifunctional methionine sulfoxide reductase B/A protein [candidate division GN15 bacterium]|nr:bifunctional methionine sulfoxide reductase B/A protein [candidate division GN15 bacterium]
MVSNKVSEDVKLNPLTPEEARVIIHKGTERPGTGKYEKHKEPGTYICKHCNAPLYKSDDKFASGCGWPSFDDEIDGAVHHSLDADGRRTEITCATCGGHLGHVFFGEGFTDKDTRHCVNSISLNFVPEGEELPQPLISSDASEANAMQASASADVDVKKAYFAGGCFWGVEHLLQQQDGVLSVKSGYMGGHKKNPNYQEVCSGTTGHAEAVEVEYDPGKVDYETLARLFFEIHDPTQVDRQGPDRGTQYRSAVFYVDQEQKKITEKLIGILEDKGYDVATEVAKADEFYEAEDYHQDYYDKKGSQPYCHFYTERF